MSERKVSIRLGIIGGKEVTAEFTQVGNAGESAFDRVGTASQRAAQKTRQSSSQIGGQLQNASYQLTDFVVQVQGGTDAARALGQQLPQLLGGFGMIGAAAGLAATLGIPFVRWLIQSRDRAKEFEEAAKNAAEKIDHLQDVQGNFTLEGLDKLVEKYGQLDSTMAHILEMEAQLAKDDAGKGQALSREALVEKIGEAGVNDVLANIKFLQTQVKAAGMEAEVFNEIMGELADETGISVEALKELAAIDLASNEEDAVRAMERFLALTQDSKLISSELRQEIIETAKASAELANANNSPSTWIGLAASEASKLAGQLWDAVKAKRALDIANAPAEAVERARQVAPYAGLPSLVDQAAGPSATEELAIYNAWKARNNRVKAEEERAGRSGAGASAGGKERNALEREAQRIFESTRSAAERYKLEIANLDEMKKAGLIDSETYLRQQEALRKEFGQQGSVIDSVTSKLEEFAKKSKESMGQLGDVIVGAFERGGDEFENFVRTGKFNWRSMIVDMIAQSARLAGMKYIFGPIGGLLSKALGGLTQGLNISAGVLHDGGDAGGGARRSVPLALFEHARRMHGGGDVLGPDEIPTILQRGERVQSRAELRKGGSGGLNVIQNFQFRDAPSMRQSRTQIAADASRAIRSAARGT